MKNYFIFILIAAIMNTGCSAQKNILAENVNASAKKQAIEDDVLQKLQSENDLVIAYAYENFAWVKSMNYFIVAQHNNEWKAYRYYKNLMPNNAGTPTSLTPVQADKTACDSLLNYMEENKAWTIHGDDKEKGYCADGNKDCNIYDAAGNRLWIITKDAALNPGYYAAEFYEECCPEKQRGLFVSIGKKIQAIVGDNSTE
ncbi:hypothetical protein [Parafilimonas sp.]|uniref:hypothetical protein n=1 Tax=Parafilimonas sp. TaxID=1969739 RepID=UPI003F7EB0B4